MKTKEQFFNQKYNDNNHKDLLTIPLYSYSDNDNIIISDEIIMSDFIKNINKNKQCNINC